MPACLPRNLEQESGEVDRRLRARVGNRNGENCDATDGCRRPRTDPHRSRQGLRCGTSREASYPLRRVSKARKRQAPHGRNGGRRRARRRRQTGPKILLRDREVLIRSRNLRESRGGGRLVRPAERSSAVRSFFSPAGTPTASHYSENLSPSNSTQPAAARHTEPTPT